MMNPDTRDYFQTEILPRIRSRARAIGRQAAFNEVLEDANYYGERSDIRVAREQVRAMLGRSYRGIDAHQI